jgi:hypothetical protein
MLAVGSSGQVLQTNGAGAPSWVTPSAGAMVFISSQTVTSTVASVNFTSGFSSTYDNYVILFDNVAPDAAVALSTRIYKNNSLVTSSTYNWQRLSIAGSSAGGTSSPGSPFSNLIILRTDGYAFGRIDIFNANSTNASFLSSAGLAGTTNTAVYIVAMNNSEANSFTGISFYDANVANNIVSGTFRLYGIVKS